MTYKNVGYMENGIVGRRNFYSGLPWIWISTDRSMYNWHFIVIAE